MHVLFNGLQALNRSGTGHYAFALLRALHGMEDGPRCTALLPRELLETFPETARFTPVACVAAPFRRMLFERFRLPGLVASHGAELVHFPANFGHDRCGVPMVVTVHDLSFLRHPAWFRADRAVYYKYAIGQSVRAARRILADSHATAADLEELLHVPRERIDVVYLGVDAAFQPASGTAVAAAREKYALPPRYILYAGTHEPRKNLPRLVEAWSREAAQLEQDLVLAGRHGWKNGALEEAIAASPHKERIHRPGFIAREDLPALMSGADAFAFPSLLEGFGLPPLEAMACGTPVLTSNTSSLPEVVGDAAVLVTPEDTADVARGLREVLARGAALGERGRARAADFTWERCARAALASYRRAAEE